MPRSINAVNKALMVLVLLNALTSIQIPDHNRFICTTCDNFTFNLQTQRVKDHHNSPVVSKSNALYLPSAVNLKSKMAPA